MKQIQNIEPEGQVQLANKYSLDDVKAFFYLMNAKPDTSIQLLEGRKKISVGCIRDLNERIQRKLQNHDLIGQIASINLIFGKGKIKDYATWAEFERETWHTINNKTEAVSITWDISVKLPRYENPQRHTLKVRIGQSISPKDMMELVFSSDDPTELREKRADGVVKVDFIDQVIASELIEKVNGWYDGLAKLPDETGIQKYIEKYQGLLVGIVHNFTPIGLLGLYHYYFISFCPWGNLINNLTLSNIQLILIAFITVFFVGSMTGKKFAKWLDNKIDDYKGISQFEITRGDENAINDAKTNNDTITRTLRNKAFLAVFSGIIGFGVKHLLELWFK
jgi:uncharacterized protein YlzI (FlbEa/FlbD family)